jgi:glycosyltransferase involved in cell wall biosynthesis
MDGTAAGLRIGDRTMSEPVRVLHINAGNLYGGVETYLSTLAECRSLCPAMVPEFALCFSGRQEDELKKSGCPVHSLGAVRFSRPWTVWRVRRALRRLIADDRYDVIVCHQPWVQALFGRLVRNLGQQYVAYFHGPCGHDWIERRARQTEPGLVVAPSAHSLGTVAASFPGAVHAVINYPLPGRLRAQPVLTETERRTLRDRCETGETEVVILQASRVESWKGPDLVIRALGHLREVPGWRFWFAGSPQRPHEEVLFREMKDLAKSGGIEDRVVFLGNRTDVPSLMQAADLYVQGNRGAEGFSLSFLEASYSSLPIVTSDLGGAAEMIGPENGILTPQGDVDALAAGLKRLIADHDARRDMGRRGHARALALSDTAQQINRLGQLLQNLKGSPR